MGPAQSMAGGGATDHGLPRLAERSQATSAFAVALVLHTTGSTPCKAGARAIIEADGTIHGTVGGGLVEAEARQRAVRAIHRGHPEVFDFALQGHAVAGSNPICGGAMRVLVDLPSFASRQTYALAARTLAQRTRGLLLTRVGPGDPVQVELQHLEETAVVEGLPFPGVDALRTVLRQESAVRFASPGAGPGQFEVLVEPLIPCPRLWIAGGGHVGQAVAWQACAVGFDVVVVDDRPEFTAPELYPEAASQRCGDMARELANVPFGPDTFVVLVTRGHRSDADALAACLGRPAAYVGMIGSRRKVALLRQELISSGRCTPADFDQVYAPIGLDIGSVTVPEIATSIVAQLIAVRRQGKAGRMK